MITNTYKLNMQPGGVPLIIHVSQYDVGETMTFNLVNTATSSSISSGVSAEIRGTKPDGNGFSYSATYSYSNSNATVSVVIKDQMTAVAGQVVCEIILYKGTPPTTQNPSGTNYQQLGTANFILNVERAALDKDTLTSESSIRQLVNVIDNSQQIIAAGSAATLASQTVQSMAQQAAQSAQTAITSSESSAQNAQSAEASAQSAAASAEEAERYAREASGDSSLINEYYYNKTEVNELLSAKANTSAIPTKTSQLTNNSGFITNSVSNLTNYYTKTQINTSLNSKANSADVYTKGEVDTALAAKANSADVYTKTQVDTSLIAKANSADVYTKSEVDTALSEMTSAATIEAEVGPSPVVSINNAAQYNALDAIIGIESVQDLHGYNNPWPAGGGKNLADFQNSDNADRRWFTYTTETAQKIQCTCNSTSKFSARFVANVENGVTYKFYKSAYTIAGENYVTPIYIYSDELWGTNIASFTIGQSSNTATWTSNITGTVVIGIYAVTGTLNNEIILSDFMMIANSETDYTFAPYSNICPIAGWTAAQVTRTGKNLLGPIATGTRAHSSVTFTANADGSISLSGTASANVSYWLNTTNVNSQYRYPLAGRTQYTLSGCPSGGSTSTYRLVGYVDIGTTYANRALSDVGGGSSNNTLDVVFDSIRVMIDIKSGTVCDGLVFWPQLELGSTATTYEPYNGEIYSITFPTEAGTVCGGTLDVTTGKLRVESVLWTKNTSTMDNGEAYPGWRNAGVAAILGTGLNSIITTVANIGTRIGINTSTANSGDVLFLNPNDYDGKTETEWKALAMDVQVVLPLATPVTYDLTPQDIALLRGINNVWADCGDTALRYFLIGVDDIIAELDANASVEVIRL